MARALALLALSAAAVPHAAALFACSAAGRSDAECAALGALYDSAGGPAWARRQGWADAASGSAPLADYCAFDGVTCDGDGHVITLALPRGGLRGSLPAALGALSRLKTLDLSYNALAGTLPPSLGALTHLRVLTLSSNLLRGGLPDALAALTALQALLLGANIFDGQLPAWLAQLPALRELDVGGNFFSGAVPAALGDVAAQFSALQLGPNQLDSAAFPPPLCAFACAAAAPPFLCPVQHSCAAAQAACATQCRYPRCPTQGLSVASFVPDAALCSDPAPAAACLDCLPALISHYYADAAGKNPVLEACLVQHSADYVAAGADPLALGMISNCGSLYGFGDSSGNTSSCPVSLGVQAFVSVAGSCGAAPHGAAACDSCVGELARVFGAAGVSVTPGADGTAAALRICCDAHVSTIVAAGADPGTLAALSQCPALTRYSTTARLDLAGIDASQLRATPLVEAVAAAAGTSLAFVYVTDVLSLNATGGRRRALLNSGATSPPSAAVLRVLLTVTAADAASMARNAAGLKAAAASGALLLALQRGGMPVTHLLLADVALVGGAPPAPADSAPAGVGARSIGAATAAAALMAAAAVLLALMHAKRRARRAAAEGDDVQASSETRGAAVRAVALGPTSPGGVTYLVAV